MNWYGWVGVGMALSVLGQSRPWLRVLDFADRLIFRAWVWLTYWRVPCAKCGGTGICGNNNPNYEYPHSCCGDCDRVTVPAARVPRDFSSVWDTLLKKHYYSFSKVSRDPWPAPEILERCTAMVGDGVMWRRPWSRRQVSRPETRRKRS